MHGQQYIKKNTYCVQQVFFENRVVYEIMWKNTVQPNRPQYCTRALHTGYLRLHIHTRNIIFIAFPLQQWLHERSSMSVFLLRPWDLGSCHIFRSTSLQASVSSTTMSSKYAVTVTLLTFLPPTPKKGMYKLHYCRWHKFTTKALLCNNIFIQLTVTRNSTTHTQNALLYFHRKVVMWTRHNVTLYVQPLICCVLPILRSTHLEVQIPG